MFLDGITLFFVSIQVHSTQGQNGNENGEQKRNELEPARNNFEPRGSEQSTAYNRAKHVVDVVMVVVHII